MTETPQNPAADLWSDYLDAATSMTTDDGGLDLYDIEGMNEAAHDIYLALVAHDARVAELEAERDAAIAEAHACGAERAVWKARAEAAEAAIQAAVARALETSALKCKAKAAITRKKAKNHTAQGKDISAAIFVGAYISARGLAATIRAIATAPEQVERIAKGEAECE